MTNELHQHLVCKKSFICLGMLNNLSKLWNVLDRGYVFHLNAMKF